MILVTVGTHLPFDRLLRGVAPLADREEMVVQRGAGEFVPPEATCVGFLPFEEFEALVRAARVVVTHAGVGSVLTCLRNGRNPIVIPRRAELGEAADNHQVALARRLDEVALARLVEDPDTLPQVVPMHEQRLVTVRADPALVGELRQFILDGISR